MVKPIWWPERILPVVGSVPNDDVEATLVGTLTPHHRFLLRE